jgi:lipopolysaccharide assembly protein A
MRYVYFVLIILVTAAVLLFTIQNLQAITVSFWTMSLRLPVSILVILVYILGMFTGGIMLSLLRSWLKGATRESGARTEKED